MKQMTPVFTTLQKIADPACFFNVVHVISLMFMTSMGSYIGPQLQILTFSMLSSRISSVRA